MSEIRYVTRAIYALGLVIALDGLAIVLAINDLGATP